MPVFCALVIDRTAWTSGCDEPWNNYWQNQLVRLDNMDTVTDNEMNMIELISTMDRFYPEEAVVF